MKDLDLSIKKDPKDLDTQLFKATTLIKIKKYNDAKSILEKIISKEPVEEDFWTAYADVLALQNKKEEALNALAVAISIDENVRINAKIDIDLKNIMNMPRFKKLVNTK